MAENEELAFQNSEFGSIRDGIAHTLNMNLSMF